MDDITLVCVASFDDPLSANMAKSRLESFKIQSVLDGEHHVAMDWFISNAVGGVKLLVRSTDYDAALIALEDEPIESSDDWSFDGDEDPEAIDLAEREACPACGSRDTYRERLKRKWIYMSILLLGIPLPFLSNRMTCQACDHQWKP